jgi:hypothetical protein
VVLGAFMLGFPYAPGRVCSCCASVSTVRSAARCAMTVRTAADPARMAVARMCLAVSANDMGTPFARVRAQKKATRVPRIGYTDRLCPDRSMARQWSFTRADCDETTPTREARLPLLAVTEARKSMASSRSHRTTRRVAWRRLPAAPCQLGAMVDPPHVRSPTLSGTARVRRRSRRGQYRCRRSSRRSGWWVPGVSISAALWRGRGGKW